MINAPWRYSSITPANGYLSDIDALFYPFNPQSPQTREELRLIAETGVIL